MLRATTRFSNGAKIRFLLIKLRSNNSRIDSEKSGAGKKVGRKMDGQEDKEKGRQRDREKEGYKSPCLLVPLPPPLPLSIPHLLAYGGRWSRRRLWHWQRLGLGDSGAFLQDIKLIGCEIGQFVHFAAGPFDFDARDFVVAVQPER
jgi:hypothetical protein